MIQGRAVFPSPPVNAIRDPSADQAGVDPTGALSVMAVCPLPSSFITQTSLLPSRVLMKRIRSPAAAGARASAAAAAATTTSHRRHCLPIPAIVPTVTLR
jgi:hypothetical protein